MTKIYKHKMFLEWKKYFKNDASAAKEEVIFRTKHHKLAMEWTSITKWALREKKPYSITALSNLCACCIFGLVYVPYTYLRYPLLIMQVYLKHRYALHRFNKYLKEWFNADGTFKE